MLSKRPRLKSALPVRALLRPQTQRKPLTTLASFPATPVSQPIPPHAEDTLAPRTSVRKRRLQRRTPQLDILPELLQVGIRKVSDLRRFIIVLALTGLVLLIPPLPGLSPEGQRALALFAFTGSILALEPVSLPIAALLIPICQIALGIDTATGAFAPFGDPVLYLILGGLFLAEALSKHGLTRRIALYIIVLSKGRLNWLLMGLMIMSALLSMWVLNTATVAVLIPVAIKIAQNVQPTEKAARVVQQLIMGIAISSSVGGMGTVMGGGENAIASGALAEVTVFGFLDWMQFGAPLVLLLMPLSWWLLSLALPVTDVVIDTAPAHAESAQLGDLKAPEREILLVLAGAVVFWVSGGSLENWLNLPDTLLSSAVIAVSAVALLSIEEVVDWNDLRRVNWGVFFVIGAGLTLGDAFTKTGASTWFAQMLAPALQGLPYPAILSVLVLVGFVLTQFLNNVPLGAMLAPVLVTLSQASGIPPVSLVVPTIMSLAPAYMLPVASARMTLVAVTGLIDKQQMMRTGLIVGLPTALVILAFFLTLNYVGWL